VKKSLLRFSIGALHPQKPIDPPVYAERRTVMAQPARAAQFKQTLVSFIDQVIPGTGGNDFSQIDSGQAPDNTKVLGGALLVPFRVNPAANYSVMFHRNIGELSAANQVRDGGFAVQIMGPGVVYHGTFGGPEGKTASPGEILPYGFYNIVSLKDRSGRPDSMQPIVITYHAVSPVQRTPDGNMVLHCGLRHAVWGEGAMHGVQAIGRSDANHIRIMKRNVLTFPGTLAP
jgi:hypothetical protein